MQYGPGAVVHRPSTVSEKLGLKQRLLSGFKLLQHTATLSVDVLLRLHCRIVPTAVATSSQTTTLQGAPDTHARAILLRFSLVTRTTALTRERRSSLHKDSLRTTTKLLQAASMQCVTTRSLSALPLLNRRLSSP